MALRLGFLIENFFVKLCSQVFYRDSYTNPYIFVGFPSHWAWGTSGVNQNSFAVLNYGVTIGTNEMLFLAKEQQKV